MSPTSTQVARRDAILAAAVAVFGAAGFADAGVDEIARRAGVAKPTVYNHFGDKRGLLLESIRWATARAQQRVMGALSGLDPSAADLRAELERVSRALIECLLSDEGTAVMRLQVSEQHHLAELDSLRLGARQATVEALAGRLAIIAAHGRLRLPDPVLAARHLMALTSDEPLAESGFGARRLQPDEVVGPVRDGVDTFLAAFGVD